MNDKAQEYLDDMILKGTHSNCCGEPMTEDGLCSDCKEHAENDEAWEDPEACELPIDRI